MNKVKISDGLAVVMLLAGVFAGWQTFLILVILLFAFCEINETLKKTMITVITFKIGVSIVSLGWNVIDQFLDAGVKVLNEVITHVEDVDLRSTLGTISSISSTAIYTVDTIITALITLTEIGFVIAILSGTKRKDNFISKKIDSYVEKAVNYINSINLTPATPTSADVINQLQQNDNIQQ